MSDVGARNEGKGGTAGNGMAATGMAATGTAGKSGKGKTGKGNGVLRTVLDMIHPPGGLRKEGKDSRLTGMTRSLERRVLGLRVTDGKRGGEEPGKG